MIGVACIYGTTHFAANQVLGDNAIPLAKSKVFNAWWFFLLLGIFFIQFVVSTWHVTVMSLKLWWKRDFSRGFTFLTTGNGRARVSVPGGLSRIERVLQRKFTRTHREGDRFFAHAGLRARIGPTIIHFGIVVILIAGLVRIVLDRQGKIMSEGRFAAAEGETSSLIFHPAFNDMRMGEHNYVPLHIPYEITVLDFDEIMHPNSDSPAYYSSLLKVKDVETGEVTIAKVDMNHSISIGGYEFHQASYSPLPPIQTHRMQFDVRDAKTGERIAVTDASPETRVQVGDEDLFLEVDGESVGQAWRLYASSNPNEPISSGKLLAKARESELSLKVVAFFPDFDFDPVEGPHTRSSQPVNPVVQVALMHDGVPSSQTFLSLDSEFNEALPEYDPLFLLELADIQVAGGAPENYEGVDWTDKDFARFVIDVKDKFTGDNVSRQTLAVGATSHDPVVFMAHDGDEPPPSGAEFAIYPVGRDIRYVTVLMVVNEPVVPYYIAGVALIFFGAMLTFTGRYRALYGEWIPESEEFLFALVPRFGTSPNPQEFAELVSELSGTPMPSEPDSLSVTPENEPATVGS